MVRITLNKPMPEIPEPVTAGLELTFDDIANVPVADAESVSDWNTFFDLPTNGSPFTSVVVESEVFYKPKYGLLYNWYAATDARLICADGWEVPEKADFDTLVSYLGGLTGMGGKIKETGLLYWNSPNTGATNEVGFNGRGNGQRPNTGIYAGLTGNGLLWSITVTGSHSVSTLQYSAASANAVQVSVWDIYGLGIRPIKTTTSLTHGQTSTYTGNDGKVYRTICIGTQEWLADNLCETKYRNGDTIPEVTDNAAWAALTTGALCAYNNDWSNAYTTACKVTLYGGSGITLKDELFNSYTHLLGVNDENGVVVAVGVKAFYQCNCESFVLNGVISLGSSVLDNNVFTGITGQTITLTIPAALMTCNGGNPDGDIQYLQANNTVTIVTV